MKLLLCICFSLTLAHADVILPLLPFGSHADLGYIPGILPLMCDQATPELCGDWPYNHIYRPEAESPDHNWVGVAVFDLDVDAQLWLWHAGYYTPTLIYGPMLSVTSIDDNGVAKGMAFPCYVRDGDWGGVNYSTDTGCDGPSRYPDPSQDFTTGAIPEPGTIALVGVSIAAVFITRRRRRIGSRK